MIEQPYVIDPNVPLKRTEHVEGCDRQCGLSCPQVDALCWEIGGVLHIHPARWDQYFTPWLKESDPKGKL